MPTPVTPVRRPLPVDVDDTDAIHAWLADLVGAQVLTMQQPIPAIHLLFDGHEEVLEWTPTAKADPGADLPATWHALSGRKGLERQVLVLRLEDAEGNTLAAVVEQTRDGSDAWWIALRPFTVQDGIGQLLADGWEQSAGEGELPEPFAQFVNARPGARPAQVLAAKRPEPKVFMCQGDLPDAVPLPTTAMEMTAWAGNEVIGGLETEGLKHLVVFLIRGRAWQKWLLSDLPTAGDDMVRWICGREDQPDMVASAQGVLIQVDGKPERAARIVGELGGARAERMILFAPKPGKPEEVIPSRWMARELGPVAEGDGWIGVKPLVAGEIVAWPIGPGTPE